jgi:hypothetical protein
MKGVGVQEIPDVRMAAEQVIACKIALVLVLKL